MATPTITGAKPLANSANEVFVTWALTTADPTGDAVTPYGDYADRTYHAFGTWGGATAVLEASLDGGTTWFTVHDPQGNAISVTADGGEGVGEVAPRIRARLSVVGVGASVTFILYGRSAKK